MRKFGFLVLALAFILGSESLLFAAPPASPTINGTWIFDVSGVDQGGAIITFDDTNSLISFTGYGCTLDFGPIHIEGTHDIDSKGVITGTYGVYDDSSPANLLITGTITGKADKKRTKISLKFSDGPNAKGIKLPGGSPDIVGPWFVTGGGQSGVSVTIDPLTVSQSNDLAFPNRVYTISGNGTVTDPDNPNIQFDGGFFLTSKSVAYGFYVAKDEVSSVIIETGIFTGKVNLSSKKFVFKLTSTEGDKGTMKGEALF